MPMAIPFIVGAAAESAVAAGTITAMEALAIEVAAAAAAAALTAQQAKSAQRRAAAANAKDLTVTVQSSVEPRRTIYGKAKVSGPIIYATTDQLNYHYMHRAIAIAAHEVDAWEDFWFNDEHLPMNFFPWTTETIQAVPFGHYANAAAIAVKMGTTTQTAMAQLVAANGNWTTDHRLLGCAYLSAQTNYSPTIYSEGLPNVAALVRGKKLFDPRTSTTAYSTNPAVVIRDYLLSAMDVAASSIDDTSFIAAANVCDEYIVVDAATTSQPLAWEAYFIAAVTVGTWELVSGTVYRQRRYTFNGVVSADVNPGSILEQMVQACAGILSYTGGQYRLVVGSYTAPTMTITEKDLRGAVAVRPKPGRRDRFNEARGTFVGPMVLYAASDFAPVKSAEFLAADNGFPSPMDLDFPFTNDAIAAARLARIILLKSRQGTVMVPCTLTALALRPGDTVALTLPALGFNAAPMRVESWGFTSDFGIDLQLREDSAAVYTWSPDLAVTDPSPNLDLPSPWSVPAVTGLAAQSGVAFSIVQNDGTIIQRTRISWDLPANNIFARWMQIQSRVAAESVWTDYPNGVDEDGFAYMLNMRTGVLQEIRVRRVNTVGATGAWTTISFTPSPVNEVENMILNSDWAEEMGYPVGATYSDTRMLRGWGPGSGSTPSPNFGRNYGGGLTWNIGRGGAWLYNPSITVNQYIYIFQWVPVIAGYEYELQVRVSLHRQYGYVAINWYTADKATSTGSIADVLDAGTGIIGSAGQLETFPKLWCKGVAPAGTGYALVHCLMQNLPTTATPGYSFWHQSMLNVAPAGVTRLTATPWRPSPMDTAEGQRIEETSALAPGPYFYTGESSVTTGYSSQGFFFTPRVTGKIDFQISVDAEITATPGGSTDVLRMAAAICPYTALYAGQVAGLAVVASTGSAPNIRKNTTADFTFNVTAGIQYYLYPVFFADSTPYLGWTVRSALMTARVTRTT
jgi:hypothetical protein